MSGERTIVHRGRMLKVAFARNRLGASPAEEFFDGLSVIEKSQLLKLFEILCNDSHGEPRNPKKFGVLDDGLYEFKSFQIRMPFAYSHGERGLVLITHGFRKKKDKTPPSEIAKAKRILQEDAEISKVCVITDKKERKQL